MDDITFRPLQPTDAGEVLTLQRAAFLAEARLYQTTEIPPLTESLDDVRREIEETHCLGAFAGPRLVGALRLGVDAEVGWISRVAVAPDQQGNGIGGRLLATAEHRAPVEVREFRLAAAERSEANVAMYTRRGYRAVGTMVDAVGIGLVIMAKQRQPG